jgi:hypothetical protein
MARREHVRGVTGPRNTVAARILNRARVWLIIIEAAGSTYRHRAWRPVRRFLLARSVLYVLFVSLLRVELATAI